MEYKIVIVGIGPGAPEYLPPVAERAIRQAKALAGSQRALDTFSSAAEKTHVITGNLAAVFSFIEENLPLGDVVVMVSGDPGYYSLLAALRKKFSPARLEVIPGISSMQLAFARLALPWQDARLVSLHGRAPEDGAFRFEEGKLLGLLTDTVYTSVKIAGLLKENGWPLDTQVYICARLSYADEEIAAMALAEAETGKEISHCIMVVVS